jgi:hypothetical protein
MSLIQSKKNREQSRGSFYSPKTLIESAKSLGLKDYSVTVTVI